MGTADRMNFGIFMAPFHRIGDNPTYALRRDLELIEFLDHLSYDEAWIGEHHSAGYEIIPSPEVFIAAAAERTRHIRLGTGVCSLPYHHPLILADRMILLDHLTLGRAMFGVGPGALPSDAFMMGIDPLRQREMMDEALEAILALFTADEPVTRECGWFTLRDARLHMRPYTRPHMEMAVAAQVSPAGARAAGKYGLGLLSLGATTAGGFDVLGSQWAVAEEMAAEHAKTVERARWRLGGPEPRHVQRPRGRGDRQGDPGPRRRTRRPDAPDGIALPLFRRLGWCARRASCRSGTAPRSSASASSPSPRTSAARRR